MTQRHAEAKHLFDHARQAAQLTAVAQSDLLKALQTVEASVGEHSSVASSALASLDAKLAALPHFDLDHAVHNLAVGTAVGVELLRASMDLGRVTGNALQTFGIDTPLRDRNITQMVEHQTEQETGYLINQDTERQKPVVSEESGEAIT